MEKAIYHVKCPKTGQHFLIETQNQNGNRSAINFVDVTESQAAQVDCAGNRPLLHAASALRACRWCGSRKIGGCSCHAGRNLCPEPGAYHYQCLFCSRLIDVRAGAGDVRELRLSVTSPKYDDIGPLLESMGLRALPFSHTGFDCDVLFINCGTTDPIDPVRLHDFVWNGGCIYVSDLAARHLVRAFPGAIEVKENGAAGTYPARVVDPELKSIIGGQASLFYDLGGWAVIRRHQGDCLICGAQSHGSAPMMVTIAQGAGRIFYTSFHNHKQASEHELAVLKLMLLRQIGSVVHQSIQDVGASLGLNISDLGRAGRR